MNKKRAIPIILTIFGLVTLVLVFGFMQPINWKKQLETNPSQGPYAAYATGANEHTRSVAVLTENANATCRMTVNNVSGNVYEANSRLVDSPNVRNVISRLDLITRYKGLDEALAQPIERNGKQYYWTANVQGAQNDNVQVNCTSEFILVDYPMIPGGVMIARILAFIAGTCSVLFGLAYWYGLKVKARRVAPVSTNEPPAATQPPSAQVDVGQKITASYSKGGVAVGGTITLTGEAVVFEPNTMNAGLAGDASAKRIVYASISKVDVAPRKFGSIDGGMRKRLRITVSDGTEHLFVVNDLEECVATIQQKLPNS